MWDMPEPSLEPNETPMLICPVCGDELNPDDTIVRSIGGRIIGCCMCLDIVSAEVALDF